MQVYLSRFLRTSTRLPRICSYKARRCFLEFPMRMSNTLACGRGCGQRKCRCRTKNRLLPTMPQPNSVRQSHWLKRKFREYTDEKGAQRECTSASVLEAGI